MLAASGRLLLGCMAGAAVGCAASDDLDRGSTSLPGADSSLGGGAGGAGGAGTGGAAGRTLDATAGGGAAGKDGGPGACQPGEKVCQGGCVPPGPSVGCSFDDCNPCPAVPAHGKPSCSGLLCDFDCDTGYARVSDRCEPDGAGGAAGSGASGAGGAGGAAAGMGGGAGTAGASGSGGATCVPPVSGPCDTAPQCGCVAGQNCLVVNPTTGETGCLAAGSTPPYHACTVSTECGVGFLCSGGNCQELCSGASAVCPGAKTDCVAVTSNGVPVPELFTCTRSCDPTDPDSAAAPYDPCGPNLHCLPADDGVADCLGPAGSGLQGDSCEGAMPDVGLCAPGHACVKLSTEPSFLCRRLCRVGGSGGCLPGDTCFAFSTKQYAGSQEIGFCE